MQSLKDYEYTAPAFLDISEAFDPIGPDILLEKLPTMEFDDKAMKMM